MSALSYDESFILRMKEKREPEKNVKNLSSFFQVLGEFPPGGHLWKKAKP
jgi:hypothetical protein